MSNPISAAGQRTVCLDEEAAAVLDEQTGDLVSGANPTRRGVDKFRETYGAFQGQAECEAARGLDIGGASRFYYVAKPSREERDFGCEGLTGPRQRARDPDDGGDSRGARPGITHTERAGAQGEVERLTAAVPHREARGGWRGRGDRDLDESPHRTGRVHKGRRRRLDAALAIALDRDFAHAEALGQALDEQDRDDDAIIKPCAVCGRDFVQRSNRQKACRACRATTPGHQPIGTLRHPDPTCVDCGQPYPRRGGPLVTRCETCQATRDDPEHVARMQRIEAAPRHDDDLETVWSGGEGLTAVNGSSLGDRR